MYTPENWIQNQIDAALDHRSGWSPFWKVVCNYSDIIQDYCDIEDLKTAKKDARECFDTYGDLPGCIVLLIDCYEGTIIRQYTSKGKFNPNIPDTLHWTEDDWEDLYLSING